MTPTIMQVIFMFGAAAAFSAGARHAASTDRGDRFLAVFLMLLGIAMLRYSFLYVPFGD